MESSPTPPSSTPPPTTFSSQLPTTLPTPIPEIPKPSSPTKPIFIVFLILIFLSSFAYAAIQFGLVQINLPGIAPKPTPIPTPKLSPAPDETANWKTYRSETLGFELRYPQVVRKNGENERDIWGEVCGYKEEEIFENSKKVYKIRDGIVLDLAGCGHDVTGLQINLKDNPKLLLPLDFWKTQLAPPVTCTHNLLPTECRMPYKFEDKNYTAVYQLEKISVGGKEAIKVITKEILGVVLWDDIYVEGKTGDMLHIEIGYFPENYQILSTFRFLDENQTTYTCPSNGWINCMPILTPQGQEACTPEAVSWYKANCPNFQGIAQ